MDLQELLAKLDAERDPSQPPRVIDITAQVIGSSLILTAQKIEKPAADDASE